MSWHAILLAILGLALLMVVHESGHYFVARAFKLRVLRFSIGFGPPLWRYTSKKTGTTFQLAIIPFIAYVQVAGMNPFEESDPTDEGSYANASLTARICSKSSIGLSAMRTISSPSFICASSAAPPATTFTALV